MGCKWSSLTATGTGNPLPHSALELGGFEESIYLRGWEYALVSFRRPMCIVSQEGVSISGHRWKTIASETSPSGRSRVHSSVINPLGKMTFAKARHGEDILHADIDLDCMALLWHWQQSSGRCAMGTSELSKTAWTQYLYSCIYFTKSLYIL